MEFSPVPLGKTLLGIASKLTARWRRRVSEQMFHPRLVACPPAAEQERRHLLGLQFARAQDSLRTGAVSEAIRTLESIASQSEANFGVADRGTLLFQDTLASAYIRFGKFECAEKLLLKLLTCRTVQDTADEARTTLSNASVVVTAYIDQKKWVDAAPLQRAVVDFLQARRGFNDTEALLSSSLLALVLVESGALAQARQLLQALSGSFVHALGREHRETHRTFFLLSLVLDKQGDSLGARAILERWYPTAVLSNGEEDELTLRMGTKLACLLLRSKLLAESQDLLLRLLPVSERTTGPASSTTLTNLNNLAVVLWERGQRGLARRIAGEVTTRRERQLGAQHVETLEAQRQVRFMDEQMEQQKQTIYSPQDRFIQMEGVGQIGEAPYTFRLRGFPMNTPRNKKRS